MAHHDWHIHIMTRYIAARQQSHRCVDGILQFAYLAFLIYFHFCPLSLTLPPFFGVHAFQELVRVQTLTAVTACHRALQWP